SDDCVWLVAPVGVRTGAVTAPVRTVASRGPRVSEALSAEVMGVAWDWAGAGRGRPAHAGSSVLIVNVSKELRPPRDSSPNFPSTTTPLYAYPVTAWPFRFTLAVVPFSVTCSV